MSNDELIKLLVLAVLYSAGVPSGKLLALKTDLDNPDKSVSGILADLLN